jgi:hypothetical protein
MEIELTLKWCSTADALKQLQEIFEINIFMVIQNVSNEQILG